MTEVVHLVVARRGLVHYCHSSLPVLLSLHSACTVIRLPPLTTNYCLMSPCSLLGLRAVQYKGSFVHCCVASFEAKACGWTPNYTAQRCLQEQSGAAASSGGLDVLHTNVEHEMALNIGD